MPFTRIMEQRNRKGKNMMNLLKKKINLLKPMGIQMDVLSRSLEVQV